MIAIKSKQSRDESVKHKHATNNLCYNKLTALLLLERMIHGLTNNILVFWLIKNIL